VKATHRVTQTTSCLTADTDRAILLFLRRNGWCEALCANSSTSCRWRTAFCWQIITHIMSSLISTKAQPQWYLSKLAWYTLCLCVLLSVTSRSYTKTDKCRITQPMSLDHAKDLTKCLLCCCRPFQEFCENSSLMFCTILLSDQITQCRKPRQCT